MLTKGLFWDTPQKRTTNDAFVNTAVEVPNTEWALPTLPRLDDVKVLSVDVETKDLNLLDKGPGWARNDGHIVGVAIGADNDKRWYLPMRHEHEPHNNLDPVHVVNFLKDVLGNANQPKVGANLLYDLGWLKTEGIDVTGDLYDVQYAEALLHEKSSVSLDYLGHKYLGQKKESSLLYAWCAKSYGGTNNGTQRANIYRAPARLVGPYAEGDVDLPLRILPLQWKLLQQQQLLNLFRMENGLIRLLLEMRFAGVTVDVLKAERLYDSVNADIHKQQKILDSAANTKVNVNAPHSLLKVFEQHKIPYATTTKGNPSFDKTALTACKHPFAKQILNIRELTIIANTFLKGYILDGHVNGKIHTQFHPLRRDDGGTRSGRYSSSTPNLQNIPSRHEIYAALIRGLFIPDEGHVDWIKMDASQIEYRLLAHFAQGDGAEALRSAYNKDPHTDYHELTQQLILNQTGVKLERKPTKSINFGFIYGMGRKALAHNLGLTKNNAAKLFDAYHEGAPFAAATMTYYTAEAEQKGYVQTILNRRSRFEQYESSQKKTAAVSYNDALRLYGPNIKRARAYTALNRVLQGSAADMLKMAMLKCYDQGLFTETGVPRLTVHDELDFSNPGGKEKYFKEIKHVFENAIKVRVPLLVDVERGPDWGHVA